MTADSFTIGGDFLAQSGLALGRIRRMLDNLTPEEWIPTIDAIFREVHSIKGSAGFFQFEHVQRVAHRFEEVLTVLRETHASPDTAVVNLLDRCHIALQAVLSTGPVPASDSIQLFFETTERFLQHKRPESRAQELVDLGTALMMREAEWPEVWDLPSVQRLMRVAEFCRREILARSSDQWIRSLLAEQTTLAPETVQALTEIDAVSRRLDESALNADEVRALRSAIQQLQDVHETDARVMTALISMEPLTRFVDDAQLVETHSFRTEFRRSVHDLVASVLSRVPKSVQRTGELLVEEGLVRPEDVAGAVARQKRIGEILIEEGKVRREDVEKTLARQRRQEDIHEIYSQDAAHVLIRRERIEWFEQKLDRLLETWAVTQQAVSESTPKLAAETAVSQLDELGRTLRVLRSHAHGLLNIRVRELTELLPRHVRELSKILGKSARLTIEGEDEEIPRVVADALSPVLIHLINNALVHGLENDSATRVSAGKDATGLIRVVARREDTGLTLEVSDDGTGLRREALRQRAVEFGFLTAAEADALGDAETDSLIFLPGLSTSSGTTAWSGRGVGMDAVQKTVESLGGSVRIENHPGEGARFLVFIDLIPAETDRTRL